MSDMQYTAKTPLEGIIYQVKGSNIRGRKLAEGSSGRVVLELETSGAITAFDRHDLEEILPYTVRVKFTRHMGPTSKDYHFRAEEGSVAVGDLIVDERYISPMIVTGLDTKHKQAEKSLKGYVYPPSKAIGH